MAQYVLELDVFAAGKSSGISKVTFLPVAHWQPRMKVVINPIHESAFLSCPNTE